MRRAPAFTAGAALTLALGLAASISLYTILECVLLRPLPYKDSSSLVATVGGIPAASFSKIKVEKTVFDEAAFIQPLSPLLTETGGLEPIPALAVSYTFFPMLGVAPVFGRTFEPNDFALGGVRVALLSYPLWVTRFHADPAVVGKMIILDSQPYTIVGVLSAKFRYRVLWYDNDVAVWIPLQISQSLQDGSSSSASPANTPSAMMVARLKRGVSLGAAEDNLRTILATVAGYKADRAYPEMSLLPLKDFRIGFAGRIVWPLFGCGVLLLIAACANASMLILARGAGRLPELVIRRALGASRKDTGLLLLTESLLLSLLGALLGFPLAISGVDIFRALAPQNDIPRLADVNVDMSIVLFAFAAIVLCSVFSGLAPALLLSRADASPTFRDSFVAGRLSHGSALNLQKIWLAGQFVAAMVLLVGASLMVQSVWLQANATLGFNLLHVLEIDLRRTTISHKPPDMARMDQRSLLEAVSELQPVKSAAFSSILIGQQSQVSFSVDDNSLSPAEMPLADISIATPGFLQMLDIPLIRGRYLRAHDCAAGNPAVLVSRSLAEAYLPGENPVGHRLRYLWANSVNAEIVGETPDTKIAGVSSPDLPQVYACGWPVSQSAATLYVKSDASVTALAGLLREKLRATASPFAVTDMRAASEVLESSLARPRFIASFLTVFVALSLTLTAIGAYSAVSISLVRHLREIGIRVALGAQKRHVLADTLGRPIRIAFAGVAIGAALSLVLTRLIRSWLYGIAPDDPLTFVLAGATLLIVCFIASYIPARRALRVDPAVVLRDE